ncbi:hypothetical protein, partial [Candidatus Accumulibacter vicinus]|uniref:hypothetical protein n=1 Tax=Candidatus Accumulibacter vicinus TaxID=2954382 RepID=UPI00054D7B34
MTKKRHSATLAGITAAALFTMTPAAAATLWEQSDFGQASAGGTHANMASNDFAATVRPCDAS